MGRGPTRCGLGLRLALLRPVLWPDRGPQPTQSVRESSRALPQAPLLLTLGLLPVALICSEAHSFTIGKCATAPACGEAPGCRPWK